MSKRKQDKEINNQLKELAARCNPYELVWDKSQLSGEDLILSGLKCDPRKIKKDLMYDVQFYHYRWINPLRQIKKLIKRCSTDELKRAAVIQFVSEHQ